MVDFGLYGIIFLIMLCLIFSNFVSFELLFQLYNTFRLWAVPLLL